MEPSMSDVGTPSPETESHGRDYVDVVRRHLREKFELEAGAFYDVALRGRVFLSGCLEEVSVGESGDPLVLKLKEDDIPGHRPSRRIIPWHAIDHYRRARRGGSS